MSQIDDATRHAPTSPQRAILPEAVRPYASLALGTAYNELFLVYIATLAAAAIALVGLIGSIDFDTVHNRGSTALPYRALARLMVVAGLVTAVVWLVPLIAAMATGDEPDLLDHYTTSVTDVLDLAFITPAVFTAALLAHRRYRATVAVAMPLLGLLIALLPNDRRPDRVPTRRRLRLHSR